MESVDVTSTNGVLHTEVSTVPEQWLSSRGGVSDDQRGASDDQSSSSSAESEDDVEASNAWRRMLTSTSPAGDEVDAALVANGEYDVITSTLVNGNGSTEKPSTTVRALVEHFEENDLLLHREREALLPNGVGMATGVAVGFETAGTASGADANTDAESDGARKRKSVLDPQASRALATAAGTDANADADTDSSTSRGSAGNGHKIAFPLFFSPECLL